MPLMIGKRIEQDMCVSFNSDEVLIVEFTSAYIRGKLEWPRNHHFAPSGIMV